MTDTSELCGPKTSRGYNQGTASGRAFYAADPRPEDVSIDDVAAHLSRICRFGGALSAEILLDFYMKFELYSVAQHSVLVADNVPEPFRLRALLHDAAEAYIGDMIKPIKLVLAPLFGPLEAGVHRAVLARFGLPEFDEEADAAIAVADYRAALTERRDLLPDNAAVNWGAPTEEPFPERVIPLLPSGARALFLQRFNELYKGK
jgi:hypothetical protein